MPLVDVKSKKEVNLGRFRLVVKVLFFLCLGLTIASIFTDVGPKSAILGAGTVILHFVKQSASVVSYK